MDFKELISKNPKFAIFTLAISAIKDSKMRASTVIILVTLIFGTPLFMLADFANLMLG